MTDQPYEDAAEDQADEAVPDDVEDAVDREDERADATAEATGHPAVDEVLRSLDVLGGRPVDEHVAVFEDAHEQLRRTLSGAGDDQD
jgi:hypothetical protein